MPSVGCFFLNAFLSSTVCQRKWEENGDITSQNVIAVADTPVTW